ncbi:hypothetical protein ACFYTQ_30890 [Nocardia sp. NPDC004068]|uniref:hypothetical protein n=1 Tax=Nocardia sp. NPDC004068 TaxID=3364303 RepID=UPI00369F975D
MLDLPKSFLINVESEIIAHNLMPDEKCTAVAFSGGKDSLLLCLALRELGVEHVAVTVDMAYSSGWAERIVRSAREHDLTVEVVNARRPRADHTAPVTLELRRRLDTLDELGGETIMTGTTPCTHCYSVKALALNSFAVMNDIPRVAFGHHLTDASASLLKEALLHIDRHVLGHERFERRHFAELVDRLWSEANAFGSAGTGELIPWIDALVGQHRVDTDEPPRQQLLANGIRDVEVIRPLHRVTESDIRTIVSRAGLHTEGSGCGHGLTAASQTPREMVHHRILDHTVGTPFATWVGELVARGIGPDGRASVNARSRRRALLGPSYKPTGNEYDKI